MQTGYSLVARCLHACGVETVFGIVGIPVAPLALEIQSEGIHFVAMRNEQAVGYAAASYSYCRCANISQRFGVMLTVPGLGVVHGLAGLMHAKFNKWPLVMLSGSCPIDHVGKGGFMESNQLKEAETFAKAVFRVNSINEIPQIICEACETALSGVPGGVYIDLPANVLNETMEILPLPISLTPLKKPLPSEDDLATIMKELKNAKSPLVVFGKGAAYAKAEQFAITFIEKTNLPFIPTPMGKGLVSDYHPNCVASARPHALAQSDVVILFGCRLNWLLHFGEPPRWNKSVQFIVVDIDNSVSYEKHKIETKPIYIVGDCSAILSGLNVMVEKEHFTLPKDFPWLKNLFEKKAQYDSEMKPLFSKEVLPLTFNCTMGTIASLMEMIPKDVEQIVVSEGANTQDYCRMIIPSKFPRCRLDPTTSGTMGSGLAAAIAACYAFKCDSERNKGKKQLVMLFVGDSSYGFSGIEVETICRYNLPVIIFLFNNDGVYGGIRNPEAASRLPGDPAPVQLTHDCRYDKLMDGCGGKGYHCTKLKELADITKQLFSDIDNLKPTMINILIDPLDGVESGHFVPH